MKIEHFAINVANPLAMAQWYTLHLGMSVVSALPAAPFTHFLADESDNVMIEIYNNPPDLVPDYANMNPLICHLAFASTDVDGDAIRLIDAGATLIDHTHLADGTHLAMLRDPWGLAIQLCRRAKPMLVCQQH